MNKRFTDEEIVKAAHCCTKNNCQTCPFIVLGAGFKNCVIKFSEYINTKNEPALSANSTSSEVSKDTDNIHIDDSTKSDICQVLASAMSTLLALRQEMEPHEKKAFDLGETYKDICCASALMSSVRKGGDGK